MKKASLIILLALSLFSDKKAMAWGPEGHAMVGRLAMGFVQDDVRKNVLKILGSMSVDTATNWMDIMKSNPDYDFMRSWHYLDFPKGKPYAATNEDNIVNRLILSYNELGHKKTLCSEQIKTDLLVIMHLMGDLHMPLHAGYDDDLGGNKVPVQYDTIKTHNLHWFWDEDIIRLTKITDEDMLQLYKDGLRDTLNRIDFVSWFQESRSLLPGVYDFPDFRLSKAYLDKNKIVVQKQLFMAGLRLAAVLNKLFADPAPLQDFKKITAGYKNGIDVKDAMQHIGKKVTVCTNVNNVRATPAITQLTLGEPYPNSTLTVVIFSRSYPNFKTVPEELYRNKNICVKGTIEENRGKARIIVENPDDIIIL